MPVGQNFVDLSNARLVAKGAVNFVFEHDDFPDALIKVVKPEMIDRQGQLIPRRRKRKIKLARRLGAFNMLHREVWEMLAFRAKPANLNRNWPVCRIHGFVETDLGFGVVVEKLVSADGALAPTLRTLIREKRFLPAHREALKLFFDELQQLHICFHDMHPGNIVFPGEPGRDGRFVAIDGLGVSTVIPLRDWSRTINAMQIRRKMKRVWALVDAADTVSAPDRTAEALSLTENRRR